MPFAERGVRCCFHWHHNSFLSHSGVYFAPAPCQTLGTLLLDIHCFPFLTSFVSSSATNSIFIWKTWNTTSSLVMAIFALILGLASSVGQLVDAWVNYMKDK